MNMLTLIRKNRSLDSNVVDFGYHPDLADHRSSNNAFGMLSSWVHARAGASQGYHTCYVKFKFDWRYFNYWFGLYFPRSTNWLTVSFKVYVYW